MMQRMMMMLLRTEIITEVLQVLRICLLDCESKGIECESPIKGWNHDCGEQRSAHHIPAKVSGKEEEDSFRINREKRPSIWATQSQQLLIATVMTSLRPRS
jgi:hypothetical protein